MIITNSPNFMLFEPSCKGVNKIKFRIRCFFIIYLCNNALLILFVLTFPLFPFAQNNNSYIEKYSAVDFFKKNISQKKLDFENIDVELLNATLYFTINKKRQRRSGDVYKWNEILTKTANLYLNEKRAIYFKPNTAKKKRIKKQLEKMVKSGGYNGAYIDVAFNYLPALNYNKSRKYFHGSRRSNVESEEFYYTPKNKTKTPEIIPTHTYQSFIGKCLKTVSNIHGQSIRHAKTYDAIGIAIALEQKSKTRMPYVKMMWVYGGSRLGKLEKEN